MKQAIALITVLLSTTCSQAKTTAAKELTEEEKVDFYVEMSIEADRLRLTDKKADFVSQTASHITGMTITEADKIKLGHMCREKFTKESCESTTPLGAASFQTSDSINAMIKWCT